VPFRHRPRSRLIFACFGVAAFGQGCLDWSKLQNGACGDGFVGREEACDDGNRISGDGCSDSCRIEPGVCGDGRQDPNEDCDDANTLNDDACLEGCKNASCGDGELHEFEEECDDGNTMSGDGCSSECRLEPAPPGPMCGNGVLDPDEACDDGNMDKADACLNGCSWATCGDGVVRKGVEECDQGAPGNGCTKGCMLCGGVPGSFYRMGNAHCYTAHSDVLSEQQARAVCQSEGGDLWTVTSQDEGTDVTSKLGLNGRYWLGLLTTKGNSSWVSGEVTMFTSFAAGEPSDVDLKCVALDAGTPGGSWLSQACNASSAFVCERSPAFVFPIDHHAYRLHTGALDVAAAQARCRDDGGHLATLETDLERQFVGKTVNLSAWLDASDAAVEGQFVWASGGAVDRSIFATGQPDDEDASQNCLLFGPADKFIDNACGEAHAYICEFD
jgi:cysteine-rich repeat protein